jgi:hypothetical protein
MSGKQCGGARYPIDFPTTSDSRCSHLLGRFWGHIQRGDSRILRVRAYLDLLAFCGSSQPDDMRAISGTFRGALVLFFASRESNFKVPPDCYTMAAHRMIGLNAERASHARKCPRCNELPPKFRGSGSSSTVSSTSMSGEHSTIAMLMGHIPGARALGTLSNSTIGLSTCFKRSCLKGGYY